MSTDEKAPLVKFLINLVVLGLGGGGTNMALEDAWVFYGVVLVLISEGKTKLVEYLLGKIRFVFIDTNKRNLLDKIGAMPPRVLCGYLHIGKTPYGTGQEAAIGFAAMQTAIKDGSVKEMVCFGDPVIVKADIAVGQGGTSGGGSELLVDYLTQELGLAILPTLAIDPCGQISYDQSVAAQEWVRRLDQKGVSLTRLNVAGLFNEDVTLDEARLEMDRVQAAATGPLLLALCHNSRWDFMDFMIQFHCSPKHKKVDMPKRLMSNAIAIDVTKTVGDAAINRAAAELLSTQHYDFELGHAGGAVLIVVGALPAKVLKKLTTELRALVNAAYVDRLSKELGGKENIKEQERGNPNFKMKDLPFPGSSKQVHIGLLIATYNGTPTVEEIPILALAERLGSSIVPTDDSGDSDEEKLLGLEEALRDEPVGIASIETAEPALEPSQRPGSNQSASQAEAIPEPLASEDKKDAEEVAQLPVEVSAPAPEQKSTSTYRSLTVLVHAAHFHKQPYAVSVLRANPYQENLPDGRRMDDVLDFPRTGEAWAHQVVKALGDLVKLKNQTTRSGSVGDENQGFSGTWATLLQSGLRIPGKWIPEKVGKKTIEYWNSKFPPEMQDWWGAITQEEQAEIQAGMSIFKVFGGEFLAELFYPAINPSALKRVRGFFGSGGGNGVLAVLAGGRNGK